MNEALFLKIGQNHVWQVGILPHWICRSLPFIFVFLPETASLDACLWVGFVNKLLGYLSRLFWSHHVTNRSILKLVLIGKGQFKSLH